MCPNRGITMNLYSYKSEFIFSHICESRISQWLFGIEISTPSLLPKHTTESCKSLGDVTASPAGSASQFGSLLCITKICGSRWVMSSLFLWCLLAVNVGTELGPGPAVELGQSSHAKQ